MALFKITITGQSRIMSCERTALPGDKLYARCTKFGCLDCMTYDFVQQLRQRGVAIDVATFTHNAGAVTAEVVDDLVKNERKSGKF